MEKIENDGLGLSGPGFSGCGKEIVMRVHIGWLTAVLIFLGSGNVRATLILEGVGPEYSALGNSHAAVLDGIEYYIETDKSVYQLGEDVEMVFRVTNLRDQDVSMTCASSPYFNQMVLQNSQTIWLRFIGYLTILTDVDLAPNEFIENSYSWNMIDRNNILIGPGEYDVVGIMYNGPWNYLENRDFTDTEIGVAITIVPEPGTLFLLLPGIVVLARKKRSKHV